jgi:hypothetical protein
MRIIAMPAIVVFAILAVCTFSKGGWLAATFAVVACLVADSVDRQAARFRTAWVLGSVLVVLIVIFWRELSAIFWFKMQTSQFGQSAQEGSGIDARWGFVTTSFYMVLENPVFGVGLSNWGAANDTFRDVLGPSYHESDNAHSAWLYILSSIGLPAFLIFSLIGVKALGLVSRTARRLRSSARRVYVFMFGAVVVLNGVVQLELLTQFWFWCLIGMCAGLISFNPESARAGHLTRGHGYTPGAGLALR